MSRKTKISGIVKIATIEKYLRGEDSLNHLAVLLDVSRQSINQWLQTYQSLGPESIYTTSKNTNYSSELKTNAVQDYLAGNGSHMDICKKYGIKSTCQLRNWILKYNSHEELKASGTGGTAIMTRGRKTTYDERIEIIKYYIEHEMNYAKTAEKYKVSYQQVYQWVNKYNSSGVDSLIDKRGKRKHENEMSELEKLRTENKLLQAEKRKAELEIAFLKKINEIERRRF
jgi:transposase-like protein